MVDADDLGSESSIVCSEPSGQAKLEDDGHTGCTSHAPCISERVFAPSKCETCLPRLQIVLDHTTGPPSSTLPEYKLLMKRFSNAAKSFRMSGTAFLPCES